MSTISNGGCTPVYFDCRPIFFAVGFFGIKDGRESFFFFLPFCLLLPFAFSLLCCDTDGNSLKLLNTLVILSMNLPFRSLLDMEYEGSEAHYYRVLRNMDRAKPIFSAIHGVW